MPSLACQQVKEVDDTPMVPTSKDRRQESVAGPKSEEVVLFPEIDDVDDGRCRTSAGHTSRQVSSIVYALTQ